jgi:hypothetical protein
MLEGPMKSMLIAVTAFCAMPVFAGTLNCRVSQNFNSVELKIEGSLKEPYDINYVGIRIDDDEKIGAVRLGNHETIQAFVRQDPSRTRLIWVQTARTKSLGLELAEATFKEHPHSKGQLFFEPIENTRQMSPSNFVGFNRVELASNYGINVNCSKIAFPFPIYDSYP